MSFTKYQSIAQYVCGLFWGNGGGGGGGVADGRKSVGTELVG